MIVRISEIDPICAMQACMDGYEVVSPYIGGSNDGSAACVDRRCWPNRPGGHRHRQRDVCDRHMLAH
jgi:adenosylhomocysteinase